ncbi:MAG: hypothetical protein IJW18_06790 [Lachnospiraceae bacterium]|nr:hypothetical protein [Lachnospiraceae bacterium]
MRLFNILELIIFPTVLVAILVAIKPLLKNRVKPSIRYALWLLVVVRMALPVAFPNIPLLAINPSDKDSDIAKEIQLSSADSEFASDEVAGMTKNEDILEGQKKTLFTTGNGLSLTGFWIIGSIILLLVYAVARLYFWLCLGEYKERYECDSPVPVYIMTKRRDCFLFGFFNKKIYIGQELIDKGLADFAIEHELSHVKQHDNIWLFVKVLMLIVFWFHPAIWVAYFNAKADGEYACNMRTVERIGEDKYPEYKEFVIGLSRIMPRPAFWEQYVYMQ